MSTKVDTAWIDQKVQELENELEVVRKKEFNVVERARRCDNIYDSLLIRWQQMILLNKSGKSGKLSHQLARAREEVEMWKPGAKQDNHIHISFEMPESNV